MQEKRVELALKEAVQARGGLCLKWVSPGNSGVPDRIILYPGGYAAMVECKAPGKTIRKGSLQRWWRQKLTALGFDHLVVSTPEEAREAAEWLLRRSKARAGASGAETDTGSGERGPECASDRRARVLL